MVRARTPIEGALVRAEYTDGSWFIYDTTGAEGQFSFPEMQTVLYNVEASKVGYVSQIQNDIEVFADQTTWVTFELLWNCFYAVGDINGSGQLNGLDVVFCVNYLRGGPFPAYVCECTPGNSWYVAGDVNGSCSFNGLDVSYMVTYLKGGPAPIPCPDCPPAP